MESLRETIESLMKQTYPRKEFIIIDNGSTDDTSKLFNNVFVGPQFRYLQIGENLGVAGARNCGFMQAKGDFIFTIDDDAILRDTEATSNAIDRLLLEPQIGILALRICNYFTGRQEKGACIVARKQRLRLDQEQEVGIFIGCGHIIRREIISLLSGYNEYYPYGHEEIDLAFRAMDEGFRILYYPRVVVYHKKVETGRHANAQKTSFQAIQLHNRIKVAIRLLPWRYVITTDIVRSGQVLCRFTKFNIFAVLYAHWLLLWQLPRLLKERRVLKHETVRRLLRLGAPVWF